MSSDPVDAPIDTCFALVEASALLQQNAERLLRAEAGLSFVQFRILVAVTEADGSTLRMTELAERVVVSRSGLTYQVSGLERAGLVARSPSEIDDRGVEVTATAAGRALVERALPPYLDGIGRLLRATLTDGEIHALVAALVRARDSMRTAAE